MSYRRTLVSYIALILCTAIAFVQIAHAQERWPVFPPPIAEWQMNVTYNAGLHERFVENLKGTIHYADNGSKVAVRASDPLRTSEVILFRFDKKREYAMSKFGEFPWQCKSGKIGAVLGVPSFIPPAGYNADWFRANAKYQGQQDGLDVFEVQVDTKPVKKIAKLYFRTQSDVLVRVEQTVVDKKGDFLYVMDVQGIHVGKQDPSFFEVPQGARC